MPRILVVLAVVLALAVPVSGQVRRPSHAPGVGHRDHGSLRRPLPSVLSEHSRSRPLREHSGLDQALVVAGEIDALVPTFRQYRDMSIGGEWRDVPSWSIRESQTCLEDARAQGLSVTPIRTTRTPIPTPVRLEGDVAGVTFLKTRRGAPFYVACELAVRMPRIAAVLRTHHVRTAWVLSSWRTAPRTSFHTMGLALDLSRFVRDDGSVLDVEHDFVLAPVSGESGHERATCDGVERSPSEDPASALRAIACALSDEGALSTVITPEYNEGHRDHFHVDVRPHDTRAFTR